MAVKEVDINSEVLYIDVIIVVVIEVGGTLALIVTPCCTRFRITRFHTTRFCTASEAVDKGIVIYRYDYILCSFNWYWPI
jgi:hypothetical protein